MTTQQSIQFIIGEPYQISLLFNAPGGKGRNKTNY